jgi:hypothetical protein
MKEPPHMLKTYKNEEPIKKGKNPFWEKNLEAFFVRNFIKNKINCINMENLSKQLI